MERRFSYSESKETVFCKGCGALAGAPSKCPVWGSHDFVSSTVPVVCSGCGAVPGLATKCKVWGSHEFKPVPRKFGDDE